MNAVNETPKPRYTESGVIRTDEKTGHDHECTISESSILDEMKRVISAGIETCNNGLLQDVFNRMAGLHNETAQGTPIDYTTYTDAQLVEAYRDYQLKGEYPNTLTREGEDLPE